jgi:hypothetical protein
MPAISYSWGYSAINANGTSVTVKPPPVYAAGNLLVMGVMAGGTAAAVSAGAPSGWTAASGSGTPGVFYKTATGSEPSSYTVTLSSTACAAVFIAAYPAATVVSSAFHSSGSDITSYSPAFPSGVTSGETVLLIAGAVAAAGDVNGNAGGQNVNLPAGPGWTTEVPVLGPALPGQTGTTVYPCCVGLAGITGSAGTPALTSPQGCAIYAGYLVLNVTGSAPPAPYTVTATAEGPTAALGVVLTVKALSGAAPLADIFDNGAYSYFYAAGTLQAPEFPITPAASGSLVYGALAMNYDVTDVTEFTPASGTTFSQNIADTLSTCVYGTFRSTGTTTASQEITLGGTAPDCVSTTGAAAEILAAPGSSLAETASVTVSALVPGDFATTALALPAAFASQPPPGSLLVAMVSANSSYGNGNGVFTISDSLGLDWVSLGYSPYPSFSGVWAAAIASPTATASLTVTPARSATARRGHYRTAALTVTPARHAVASGLHYSATASLTVTPVRTATARVGAPASAVLDEAGSPVLDEAGGFVLDETGTTSLTATASLTVTPSRSAARARGHYRTAALTVTPVRSASPSGAHYNVTATLVVTPVLTATTGGSGAPPANAVLDEAGLGIQDEAGAFVLDESTPGVQRASASLTVTPVLTATAEVPANAGPWTAARAGLPADSSATNWASQVTQFLTAHRVTPVYQGTRIWEVAAVSTGVSGAFSWLGQPGTGWLPAYDVSQPFTLAAGFGSVGRVQVPVQASGNGADLQVLLCADSAGSPDLASPLASVIIPASHVTQASATGSLASAGPLVVARHNTSLIGTYSTGPWTQPAVSSNGAGSFATPATSGNFTALIGGLDSTANVASGYTATIAYQGGSVSGGITQPALPQPAWFAAAAITPDSVVVAGGKNATAEFATVWTAPWTPGTGTIGAWSQQTALPAANVYGAMAAWNTTVYVIGGSPNATAASATALVWTASSQSGQVTAWTQCPPLPQALMQVYAAVVGNWLIVAGGTNASNAAVASTWYSAINSDGSLAGWQQGPPLPQATAAFGPGWNLAVTDSAVIIVSGFAGGESFSPYTQVLSVSPDGPSDAWQVQDWSGSTVGAFQCGIYPSGPSGQWQLFNLHTTSYDVAGLGPVALVSVPVPATGLTAGNVYHVVMRQSGGNLNDSLAVGVLQSSGTGWLHAPRGSDASWTSTTGQQVAMNVYDGSAAGNALHLVQDSGAGLTTLVRSGADGLLAGVMESAAFPSESPESVLGTVTEVTWSGGLPSGLVTLA